MLNEHEAREAAAMGWQLCEVWDERKKVLLLAILPTSFEKLSTSDAIRLVTTMAKQHNPLAIKALTLVAQSLIPKKARKK